MSVLLSLIVAVPLACVAFRRLLSFVGVMALGGITLMLGTAKASWRHRWLHRRRESSAASSFQSFIDRLHSRPISALPYWSTSGILVSPTDDPNPSP
jgi:hypothetical protein